MADILHKKGFLDMDDDMVEKIKKSFEDGALAMVREIENGKTI